MAVWSWKRSGWINSCLAASLLISVITSTCSTVIRVQFTAVTHSNRCLGGLNPEIGALNLFLYFSVILGSLSVILRYSYIVDQTQVMPTAVEYINKIAVFTGIISFMGLLIIASFPLPLENTGSLMQSIGFYLFIGLGMIFVILQTLLTYASVRCSITFIIRLCLLICLVSVFISSVILIEVYKTSSVLPKEELNGSLKDSFSSDYSLKDRIINYPDINNSTVENHLQLVVCGLEWSSVLIYAVFFLSFLQDFQKISTYVILRPFIAPSSNDFRSSSMTVNERV